jgi:outer membrane lipoprotein-sorting protein
MKSLLFIFNLLVSATWVWSQEVQITQDPEAKVILDRVAEKARALKSIQADFELVIEDRVEKRKSSSAGNVLIKQSKYKVTNEGSIIYFNGITMWTYMPANNEVTITEPDNQGDDFMSNPASIFSLYNQGFKYRYVRETTIKGIRFHEIDLFPKDLNQPYSRIKIFIGVKTEMPEIINTIGKNGVDYNIMLKNYSLDQEINDATFIFDPAKFKKVEVVDLRGVQ